MNTIGPPCSYHGPITPGARKEGLTSNAGGFRTFHTGGTMNKNVRKMMTPRQKKRRERWHLAEKTKASKIKYYTWRCSSTSPIKSNTTLQNNVLLSG